MTSNHFRVRRAATSVAAFSCIIGLQAGAQTQSTQDEAAGALEEVIVTAERREAGLQKTPLAITALSGEELLRRGAADPQSLNKAVPGVNIGTAGGPQTSIFVRGIGSFSGNAYGDPAVAFSVDDVYVARPTGPTGTFFDVDRVEVLKGPQGTLYGRNATGGAINVITRKPTFDFEAQAGLELGNYSHVKANGAINVPLSDTLAIRAAVQSVEHDGYLTNGYGDADALSARLNVLYQANEDISLLISSDYFSEKGQGPGDVPLNAAGDYANPEDAWRSPPPGDPLVNVPCRTVFPYCAQQDGFVDNANWSVSAKLDWDLGFGTLTLIPAYRNTHPHYLAYNQAFRQQIDQEARQRTGEARLASRADSALTWVAGAFYLDETQTATQRYTQVSGPLNVNLTDLSDESWAVFGQATYALTDALRITGGLRYTEETKQQEGASHIPNIPALACPTFLDATNRCVVPNGGKASWAETNWKVGIEYDVGAASMLYANATTGFKAGGFYNGLPPNTYEPEKITAYALGLKNRFLDGRMQLNFEAFYYDYTDLQISVYGTLKPAGFTLLVKNVASASLYGLETDFQLAVGDGGRLYANVLYNHTEYKDFSLPSVSANPLDPTCQLPTTVCVQRAADFSGQQMIRAPEWSGALGYEHVWAVGAGGEVILGLRTYAETDAWLSYDQTLPGVKREAFTSSDADLSYAWNEGRWIITAYVNNIEDEPVPFRANRSSVTGSTWVPVGPPRTYGVRVRVDF